MCRIEKAYISIPCEQMTADNRRNRCIVPLSESEFIKFAANMDWDLDRRLMHAYNDDNQLLGIWIGTGTATFYSR